MSPDKPSHQLQELGNEFKCQKLVNQWIGSDMPSSQVIPNLHKMLMDGSEDYAKKGVLPVAPGVYRNIDVSTDGEPENYYAFGLDVSPTMGKYTKDLDDLLQNLPRSPIGNIDSIVESAARYYYAFERIHPFLDGNGRVGRMIVKRILKGAGLKDLVFRSDLGKGRNSHLDAIKAVNKSGNISYIEIYLLDQIALRYLGNGDGNLHDEIERVRAKKIESIRQQKAPYPITRIWNGFEGMDIAGVFENGGK